MDKEKSSYKHQKQYYDGVWSDAAIKKLSLDQICRREFIVNSIRLIKSESNHALHIIDLGCGSGWITDLLSEYGDVVGVDLSVNVARKLYPNLMFKEANVVTDNIDGEYDVIISSEVIEHFSPEDQGTYVKKAYELLGEASYLILTTPNRPKTLQSSQPIENRLDKISLNSLLAPYFLVKSFGSVYFRPYFVRKNRYFTFIFNFLYTHLRLYKLLDQAFKTSSQGVYLTVIAQKR
ncbi:class I SAM-dependent methyltransferase [Chloroflexota bacterium]